MKTSLLAPLALAAAALAAPASAVTYTVENNTQVASDTLLAPLVAGDTLLLDTTVTAPNLVPGAVSQSVSFTVGAAGLTGLIGSAVWAVSTAAGPGPRLVGVNIDILDATNTVVLSDTFAGLLAGFAHSTFAGALGPGSYTLVATGNAVRDVVLDVSISLVPEPHAYAMMLAGLGVAGLIAVRRRPR